MPRDRDRLAAELRQLRRSAGLSADALGHRLGWSQSKVSKLENGTRGASPADVAAWAGATGATPEQRAELAGLAESAVSQGSSWWESHAGGMVARQLEIAEDEARATRIANFHPLLIPPHLQTAAYALAVMRLANVTGQDDVRAAAAARVQRAAVLYDPARRMDYVIPEAALRWRLSDDPAVMRGMAGQMISVDSLPNVSITVLPVSVTAPVLPYAGFGIFEVPGAPYVIVEAPSAELTVTAEQEIDVYRQQFAALQAAGITGPEAHALIREAIPEI